jgi:hypothetical protein
MTRGLVLLVAALVAGCVSMTEAECRSTNWYQLGERDGLIYGMRPQIDQYAHQCSQFGVQPAEKDYITGWTDGYREHEKRIAATPN